MYIKQHRRALYGILRTNGYSCAMSEDFIGYLFKIESTRGAKALVEILKDRFHALVSGDLQRFRRHTDGTWYGVWRWISRLALRSRRGLRSALRILRLYGLFTHTAPTISDYVKHRNRIKERVDHGDWPDLEMSSTFVDYRPKSRTLRYTMQYPLGTKRAPLKNGKKLAEVFISPKEHIESLDDFPRFVISHYPVLASLVGDSLPDRSHYVYLLGRPVKDTAGYAVLISKDRGLKLRLIANCNRLLQLCLSPLHNFLMDFLDIYPTCFVHDQDKGADWVADKMSKGWTLTSLDLKSATDNIPLSPQLSLVLEMAPELSRQIEMFRSVARMDWRTSEGINLSWTLGHPMGINASFALFTTWLIHIFDHVGAEGQFCIVGDDLVFNSNFEFEVLDLLHQYEVPISRSKSLFHDSLHAEFVGRVLDAHGSLDVYKASEFKYSDPAGLIRQYGFRALRFLGPRRLFGKNNYRTVMEVIRHYSQTEDLQSIIKSFASPLEVFQLENRIPPPPNVGGVSQTIIAKMTEEIKTSPRLTSDNLGFLEKMSRFKDEAPVHTRGPVSFYLALITGSRRQYRMMQPGSAFIEISKDPTVMRVKAFSVKVNDPGHVSVNKQARKLLPNSNYQEEVESILNTLHSDFPCEQLVDALKAEKLALAGRKTRPVKPESAGKHKVFGTREIIPVRKLYNIINRVISRMITQFKLK